MRFSKKLFCTVAEDSTEYRQDIFPDDEIILRLKALGVDILAFRERSWCSRWIRKPSSRTRVCKDNVALAEFDDYGEWLRQLPQKTRIRLRRAKEKRLEVRVVNPSEQAPYNAETEGSKLAKGMWEIYNETPIRQFRRFNHYGIPFSLVQEHVFTTENVLIGAYLWTEEKKDGYLQLKHRLVGFVELECGTDTGVFSQILSSINFRDAMPNNALIAKTVEVCSDKGLRWLVYARMDNHPSLDRFKHDNGFKRQEIQRAFMPLNCKGQIAMLFGLHRELRDSTPNFVKPVAIPLFNWVSRTRIFLAHTIEVSRHTLGT